MAGSKTTFRASPLYIDGRKIAEISDVTFTHESGDEPQFGIEGLLGYSEGADTTKISFKTVTPYAGHEKTLADYIRQKKYGTYGVFVDGKLEQIDGRMISRAYTSNSKTGTVTGDFEVTGGRPTAA